VKRKKFVTRTIRPDGTVRVYGRDFSCRADVTPFIGDSPIFGVYLDHNGEATGLALWGHDEDEWPGRYCHEDGHFYWMFWHQVQA
jgi:hypothetical protein